MVTTQKGGANLNTTLSDFSEKLSALCSTILAHRSFEQYQTETSPKVCGRYAAFISVCDTRSRARVLRAAADTPEAAWGSACEKATDYIKRHSFEPVWIKADILSESRTVPTAEVISQIAGGYHEFFRHGISFHDDMSSAFIEAELNGSRVISYKKKTLELVVINKFLAAIGAKTLSAMPETLVLFDCKCAFCDENGEVYSLYGSGADCGRRVIPKFTDKIALDVINTSSEYLSMQVGQDGKFDYGYYPVYHSEISGYNIMRHTASIWNMLCAYRLFKDSFMLRQIESAIGYMLKNSFYKYRKRDGDDNILFLADKYNGEVKIGANAVAIITLTEYMNVTESDKFYDYCRDYGNGIMELYDDGDGTFYHVLDYPSLSPKEKFRTVYYDGETLFALCRLYGLTKDERWLNTARKAADGFIEKNYVRFADHWTAYAMNELCKYCTDDKYLSFGLRNAQDNLEKIYRCATTYHTYLELLCVTAQLYFRIKDNNIPCSYLEQFDEKRFAQTIFHRAEYMLNGYCYPEYVMYFKQPSQALGAFFVRHDGYRIRIDDIQHFSSAYYSLYRNYARLEEILDKTDASR